MIFDQTIHFPFCNRYSIHFRMAVGLSGSQCEKFRAFGVALGSREKEFGVLHAASWSGR